MRISEKNGQLNDRLIKKRKPSVASLRRSLISLMHRKKKQVQKPRRPPSTTNGNNSTMLQSARP